jgi:predicted ArsR family transcriptional regulator
MKRTTTEAARELGLSVEAIRKYLQRYELGEKVGRDWFLDDDDLAFIRERRGRRGRPPGIRVASNWRGRI